MFASRQRHPVWSNMTPVDIAAQWHWTEDWLWASEANFNVATDPTIQTRQPGFGVYSFIESCSHIK